MEINRTILIADASEDFRSVLVEALRLEEGLTSSPRPETVWRPSNSSGNGNRTCW